MAINEKVVNRRAIEALRAGVLIKTLFGYWEVLNPYWKKGLLSGYNLLNKVSQIINRVKAYCWRGILELANLIYWSILKVLPSDANFVCSKIVISKETPLSHPLKMYRSAIESATVPGRRGNALNSVAYSLNPRIDGYANLYKYINSPKCDISSRFAATLIFI